MDSATKINLDMLFEVFKGDRTQVAEVIRCFVEGFLQVEADLDKAAITTDPDLLEKVSHKLKGSALNFNASGIVSTALELEKMGKNNSMEGAVDKIQKLKQELKEFKVMINEYL
ncbi:MAG TPA: Hpt domain-containing protein [Clostridia bacterium]